MAENSSDTGVEKFIGAPISAAVTALVTWLTVGSTGAVSATLVHLLAIAGGIFGLAFALLYQRYVVSLW
jgi:hypothetical protein